MKNGRRSDAPTVLSQPGERWTHAAVYRPAGARGICKSPHPGGEPCLSPTMGPLALRADPHGVTDSAPAQRHHASRRCRSWRWGAIASRRPADGAARTSWTPTRRKMATATARSAASPAAWSWPLLRRLRGAFRATSRNLLPRGWTMSTEATTRTERGVAVAAGTVVGPDGRVGWFSRTPGCSVRCAAWAGHDPAAHEAFGRAQSRAEQE